MSARTGIYLARSISGSISAHVYDRKLSFTTFNSIGVNMGGASAALFAKSVPSEVVAEADPDIRQGDEWMTGLQWYAGANGVLSNDPQLTALGWRCIGWSSAGASLIDMGPTDLSVGFALSFSGVVLRRQVTSSPPVQRSLMHFKDLHVTDAWYAMPGATVTASVSGSCGSAGSTVTINNGSTDIVFDPTVVVGFNVAGWKPPALAYEPSGIRTIATLNVSNCNFDPVLGHPIGGISSDEPRTSAIITGSGSSLTLTDDLSVASPNEGYYILINCQPSIMGSWDTRAYKFDENLIESSNSNNELLSPLWNAGYLKADGKGGGSSISLSGLPDFNIAKCGIGIGAPIAKPPLAEGTIYPGFSDTISVNLDKKWLLQNQIFCSRNSDLSDEYFLIEALDNSICALQVPGLDGETAINNGTTTVLPYSKTVFGVNPAFPSLFPVAVDKANPAVDPNYRFQQTGDLIDHHDPSYPGSLLRWYLPPSLYTDSKPHGGNVVLSIQTRYWDYLSVLTNPDSWHDWRCMYKLKRRAAGVSEMGGTEKTEPLYAEDLFTLSGAPYVAITLNKPSWSEIKSTLTIGYSEVSISDSHKTSTIERCEDFSYSRSHSTVSYTITFPPESDPSWNPDGTPVQADSTVIVDLLCPDDGSTPHLFVLDSIALNGLSIPVCTNSQAPSNVQQGGYLEWYSTADKGFKASIDTGTDHTGRKNETATQQMEGGVIDYWDYQGYFGGMVYENAGDLRLGDMPGEPWAAGASEVPCWGIIEPMQHKSDDESNVELHYLRAMTDALVPFQRDTMTSVWNNDAYQAMVTSIGPSGTRESMGGDWMNGLVPHQRNGVLRGTGQANEVAGIDFGACYRVRSWKLAHGVKYGIVVRQPLFGETRMLLKTNDGKRRVTPSWLFSQGIGAQYIIYEKVVGYYDKNGKSISDPEGLQPSSVWYVLESGTVSDRLDGNGVFRLPPTKPLQSGIWDPSLGDIVSNQTETVTKSRYLFFWSDSTWSNFIDGPTDVNIPKMRSDKGYLGSQEMQDGPDEGLWKLSSQNIAVLVSGSQLIRLRCSIEAIVREGYLWTRSNTDSEWQKRCEVPDKSQIQILSCKDTDNIAFIEDPVYQSTNLGDTIIVGTPRGAPKSITMWAKDLSPAKATDCRIYPDGYGLVIGTNGNTILAAGMNSKSEEHVNVATISEGSPWPLIYRGPNGVFNIFSFTGGKFRSFKSLNNGKIWQSEENQDVDGGSFSLASLWVGRDGTQMVAGYHGGSVYFTYRGSNGGNWSNPKKISDSAASPYIVESVSGRMEIGWYTNEVWVRYQAFGVDDDWAIVTDGSEEGTSSTTRSG